MRGVGDRCGVLAGSERTGIDWVLDLAMSKPRPANLRVLGNYFNGLRAYIHPSVNDDVQLQNDIWQGGGDVAKGSTTATMALCTEINAMQMRLNLGPGRKTCGRIIMFDARVRY